MYYYLPDPTRVWSRVQNACTYNTNNNNYNNIYNALTGNQTTFQQANYEKQLFNKGNILQYKSNSAGLTKQQKYAQLAKGGGPNRTKSYASQSQTHTNPNTTNMSRVKYETFKVDNLIVGKPNNISGPFKYNVQNPDGCYDNSVKSGGNLVCGTQTNPCTGEIIKENTSKSVVCNMSYCSDVPGSPTELCWDNRINTFYPRQKYTMNNSGNKFPQGYKGLTSALFPLPPIIQFEYRTETTIVISITNNSTKCLPISSYNIYINGDLYETNIIQGIIPLVNKKKGAIYYEINYTLQLDNTDDLNVDVVIGDEVTIPIFESQTKNTDELNVDVVFDDGNIPIIETPTKNTESIEFKHILDSTKNDNSIQIQSNKSPDETLNDLFLKKINQMCDLMNATQFYLGQHDDKSKNIKKQEKSTRNDFIKNIAINKFKPEKTQTLHYNNSKAPTSKIHTSKAPTSKAPTPKTSFTINSTSVVDYTTTPIPVQGGQGGEIVQTLTETGLSNDIVFDTRITPITVFDTVEIKRCDANVYTNLFTTDSIKQVNSILENYNNFVGLDDDTRVDLNAYNNLNVDLYNLQQTLDPRCHFYNIIDIFMNVWAGLYNAYNQKNDCRVLGVNSENWRLDSITLNNMDKLNEFIKKLNSKSLIAEFEVKSTLAIIKPRYAKYHELYGVPDKLLYDPSKLYYVDSII